MSALWAPLVDRSDSRRSRQETKPGLRPVAKPVRRLSRIPFLMVLAGILGLGMVGLLLLNTTLQNEAFQARALNQQAAELSYHQAALEGQVDKVRAPQELASRASALGMRPNIYPVYLILPEGKVIGKPTPVKGNELGESVLKPPEQFAAEQAAKHQAAVKKAAAEKAAVEKAAVEKAAGQKAARATSVEGQTAGKSTTAQPGTSADQAKKRTRNR